MTAAAFLNVLTDVLLLMRAEGILTATALDDTKLDTIQEDANFALKVEHILKAHGVHTPDNLDRVLQLLPIVAGFIR